MRVVKIKNLTNETKNWIKEFSANEVYQLPEDNVALLAKYASCDSLLKAIADSEAQIGNDEGFFSSINDQINWLKGDVPREVFSYIQATPPFAEPLFRTKRNAAGVIEISANSSENIDYLVSEERYVSGGEVCVQNAELGDYIEACIYDKESVIPSAYRSLLCENWPVVATYVEKAFITKQGEYSTMVMNTYPLNAKITAGLYMRITYTAANSGTTRKAIVNYYFTKKL